MTRQLVTGALLAALVLLGSIVATPRAAPEPSRGLGQLGAPQNVGASVLGTSSGVGGSPATERGAPTQSATPDPALAAEQVREWSRPVSTQPVAGTSGPSVPTPLDAVTRQGTLSYVGARFGRLYLALPEPRGTVARICGPAACVTRTSTDFGPDQRVNPDRIADLSEADWLTVSGVPLSYGLTSGTVTIERRPSTTLPETDQEAVQ